MGFFGLNISRVKGMIFTLSSQTWVHWQLGWDIFVAAVTLTYMIPSYYLATHFFHPVARYNFVFVNIIINVLFPAFYILRIRGEPTEHLGLTRRRWLSSLLISIALLAVSLPGAMIFLAGIPQELVFSTFIVNGLILWEPFFVFCWLQLRFERAFGILPSIILAGVCFGSYHLGTYPNEMVVMLALIGMMYGTVFRLTKNLLIVWPLTWMGASTIGTVSGGLTFGWESVLNSSLILLVQGIVLSRLIKTASSP